MVRIWMWTGEGDVKDASLSGATGYMFVLPFGLLATH